MAVRRVVSAERLASGARSARAVRANSSIAVYRRIDSSVVSAHCDCVHTQLRLRVRERVGCTHELQLVCSRLRESWSSTERHTACLVQLLWTCAREALDTACWQCALATPATTREVKVINFPSRDASARKKTCSHKPCWWLSAWRPPMRCSCRGATSPNPLALVRPHSHQSQTPPTSRRALKVPTTAGRRRRRTKRP